MNSKVIGEKNKKIAEKESLLGSVSTKMLNNIQITIEDIVVKLTDIEGKTVYDFCCV